ncbi:MAG: metallophosphoesterase [Clostridia bacterium]|nr:metallophosphoesterase [Clostridia bacterium]
MKWIRENIKYGPAFQTAHVEEKALALPPSCASLAGRSLLFVSDIHLSGRFPRPALDALLAQINSLRPDLILLGGDYAESREWQEEFFPLAGRLHAPLGIYAVAGNNDMECFCEDLDSMKKVAARSGVSLLVNEAVRLRIDGSALTIAGMDEFHHADAPTSPLFTDSDADAYRILLAHYPQSAAQYRSCGFAPQPHLALAGHTHGGQFRLFGLTPYSVGYEFRMKGVRLPAVSGWRAMGETDLLVSRGIGTSKLPLRIGANPEIHLLRLTK